MLEEKNCPREERELPIIAHVPEEILPTKDSVSAVIKGKQGFHLDAIDSFFTWRKAENELVVYCGYGYCDTPIPKSYNRLIISDDAENSIITQATVQHVIWNGILPLHMIEHGHKIICIISFDEGIPNELNSLTDWEDFQHGTYQYDKFGLCDNNDAEAIMRKKRRLRKANKS